MSPTVLLPTPDLPSRTASSVIYSLPPCARTGTPSSKSPVQPQHWYAVVSDAGATAGIYTDWFTEVQPRVIGAKKTVYHKFR